MAICESCPREIKPTGRSGRPSPFCKWCRTRKKKVIHSCRRCKTELPKPQLKLGMVRTRWPRFCESCRILQAQESYQRSIKKLKASKEKSSPPRQSRLVSKQAPEKHTESLKQITHGEAIRAFDAMMKACL